MATSLAAIGFRLAFIFALPVVSGDSLIYGDIAKNWLRYGVFGLSTDHGVQPTYIRLPGYPAFLALIFKVFGMEHYNAAMFTQILVDLGTCCLVAALTMEVFSESRDEATRHFAERAALSSFLLTAFCPFLANYVSAPLSETWSIFLTALALLLGARGIRHLGSEDRRSDLRLWASCGAVVGVAIMFRPDNGLLAAVLGGALLIALLRLPQKRRVFNAG